MNIRLVMKKLQEREKSDLQKRKSTGWMKTKYLIPIALGIIYLQGYAYHVGRLTGYEIRDFFYPLSYEGTLLSSYFFFTTYYNFIITGIITICGINIIMSILVKNQSEAKKKSDNRAIRALQEFKDKHKNAISSSGWALGLGNAFIFIFLLVIIPPYLVGRSESKEDLEKFKCKNADVDLKLTNGGNILTLPVIILRGNDKLVTVLTKDNDKDKYNKIMTIPLSQVQSITQKETGTQNKKAQKK